MPRLAHPPRSVPVAHGTPLQFTLNPHWTMCALVVVNAACNTALPLFIDRWAAGRGRLAGCWWCRAAAARLLPLAGATACLPCAAAKAAAARPRLEPRPPPPPAARPPARLLNPLAAILISVTAILIFAEIAPQAVCKRYGLEIGAYCSWLVRFLMVVTAPVSWPLGKVRRPAPAATLGCQLGGRVGGGADGRCLSALCCEHTHPTPTPTQQTLDWLLGEESALFRRQELKALVGIHAETQHDGSGGQGQGAEASPGRPCGAACGGGSSGVLRRQQAGSLQAWPPSPPLPCCAAPRSGRADL